jgi:hypothetical protein
MKPALISFISSVKDSDPLAGTVLRFSQSFFSQMQWSCVLTLFGMYGSQHFGLKGSYSFAIGFFF